MGLYTLYGIALTVLFYILSLLIQNVWMIILITMAIGLGVLFIKMKAIKNVFGLVKD
jgi:hypothetical protein